MYDKFSKGETVKNEESISSSFPASQDIELWNNSEQRRYEIFERPVRNLFENTKENEAFKQYLQKTLKLGRNIDNTGIENSILKGCELEVSTISAVNYVTVTPGLFIVNEELYQIYPTVFVASRQLEKLAGMKTDDGLEYINITYDGLFHADIRLNSVSHSIPGKARGIELIHDIITYLNGKSSISEPSTLISITENIENVQLEPAFKTTGTLQHIVFDDGKISIEASTAGFEIGTVIDTTTILTGKIWDGLGTEAFKDDSVTNTKLANMGNKTIKGRVEEGDGDPQDIEKSDLVTSFQMVTTDDAQTIIGTKIFEADQKIKNDIQLIFKDPSAETGWGIKNNPSSSLLILNNTTPIITIKNDNDVVIASKDFSLTSSGVIGLTGNTTVTGTFNATGDTDLDGTLNVDGATTLNDTLEIVGAKATTLGGTLEVDGATTLNNTLNIVGEHATTLGGALTVTGVTTLSDNLAVATNKTTTLGGDLTVAGTTTLNDNLTVATNKTTTLGGDLTVTGATTLNNTLDTIGVVTLSNTTTSISSSTGALIVAGGVGIGENLNVGGDLDVVANTSIGGTLSTAGISTFNGLLNANGGIATGTNKFTVDTNGNTVVDGTLTVAGITSLNNNLSVANNKATTLGGTLTVSGITTLNEKTTVNNDFFVTASANEKIQIISVAGTTITGSAGFILSETNEDTFHISESGGTGNIFYVDTDKISSNVATTINNTLGVTGLSTLDSLSVTDNTTVGGTLGVTGLSTLDSLSVTSSATVGGTLGVAGLSTLNSLGVTNNATVGGTLGVTGTSSFTGQITAAGVITSSSNIVTTSTGNISSATTITAEKDIISNSGSLNIKKRNFSINLGNSVGAIYDWTISKTNDTDIGSFEIKNSGSTTNGIFSISGTGLVKALQFETNGDYTLNNLNVKKFNGHTIVNTATPSTSNGTDQILWVANGGTIINRTTFTSLPIAKSTDDGDAVNMNGLMPSGSLGRLKILEDIAGLTAEGGVNLIGTVNEKGVDVGDGGGGNVTIYGSDISISDSVSTTIATRLSDNADELIRLKGHIPTGAVSSGDYEVMLKDGTTVSWGKITDSQLNSTISNLRPKSTTGTPVLNWLPLAFWNSDGNGLLRDHDVVYSQTDDTLTATNVTSRSSRAVKKDIVPFEPSAFDILDQVEVVSFHYINDETQADKVGFIAEDSPELVAGINHDKMEMGNCIGLLIKAVQELKQENKELREIINGYRNA